MGGVEGAWLAVSRGRDDSPNHRPVVAQRLRELGLGGCELVVDGGRVSEIEAAAGLACREGKQRYDVSVICMERLYRTSILLILTPRKDSTRDSLRYLDSCSGGHDTGQLARSRPRASR